jgi:rare lipoprotein A
LFLFIFCSFSLFILTKKCMQLLTFSPFHRIHAHLLERTALFVGICCIAALSACSSSVRFSSNSTTGGETRPITLAKSSRTPPTTPKDHEIPATEQARSDYRATGLKATELTFSGMASYYGNEFQGRKTASGERYDRYEFSAAHRTLPFGTMLKIRNKANDRTVIVRVNDRGPWKETRILDLSLAAAQELDLVKSGTASIEATVVEVQ